MLLPPSPVQLEKRPAAASGLCLATIVPLPPSDTDSISAAFEAASIAFALFASSYDAIILNSMALTWSSIVCSVRSDPLVSPTLSRLLDGSNGPFLVEEDPLWWYPWMDSYIVLARGDLKDLQVGSGFSASSSVLSRSDSEVK